MSRPGLWAEPDAGVRWTFSGLAGPADRFCTHRTMLLKHVPTREIDSSNQADKARHDKMVELVERMLDPSASSGQALHKQSPKAKTPHVWADSSQPTADGRLPLIVAWLGNQTGRLKN